MKFNSFFFILEPLTPVHIGSGESLEPMDYVINSDNGKSFFHHIDLKAWVQNHPDPGDLAVFFGNRPLPAIRRRIHEEIDLDLFAGPKIRVDNQEIANLYQEELGDQESANRLLIDRAVCNPDTQSLIIPGSSIKGAIRTVIIDYLDRVMGLQLKNAAASDRGGRNTEYNRQLETYLGQIRDSVFKGLKISDCQAGMGHAQIVSAIETRQNPGKIATPKNNCMATLSFSTKDHTCFLYGKMSIGHPQWDSKPHLTIKNEKFDYNRIKELCNQFFYKRFQDETSKFYTYPHLKDTAEVVNNVNSRIIDSGHDGILLRIGHYSHIECMTITNNKPFTRWDNRGNKPYPYGTTRTLANGLHPFGWVLLRLCSEEEYLNGIKKIEDHDTQILGQKAKRLKIAQEAKLEQLRLKQLEEEKRLDQERKEREQQKLLESMSKEERELYLLEQGELNDNQIFELYGKLDSMDDNLKVRAAKLISREWKAQKRWTKKECSKKQWHKVQVLKKILGE